MEKKKRYIIKRIRKSRYFALYLYVLFVLMLTTSVASYAWFTMSKTPRVSNMEMYITSGAGLELSADPGAVEWTNTLDIYSTKELQQFGDERPFLRQVSWSDAEQCFYGPKYGYDGRLRKLLTWTKLSDETHANQLAEDGYYMKATFYARSGHTTDVRLLDPVTQAEKNIPGDGTYVIGYPDNTGKGPEVAVRLGMKMAYVDTGGNPLPEKNVEPSLMYIYEPNADYHADGVTQGYVPTYSIHDPAVELVDPMSGRHIIQNFTFGDMRGEFLENPTLFSLQSGEIVRIELYIWLEGQDIDCSNVMSAVPDGVNLEELSEEDERYDYYMNNYRQIRANLQFTGSAEDQSGMIPIPPPEEPSPEPNPNE